MTTAVSSATSASQGYDFQAEASKVIALRDNLIDQAEKSSLLTADASKLSPDLVQFANRYRRLVVEKRLQRKYEVERQRGIYKLDGKLHLLDDEDVQDDPWYNERLKEALDITEGFGVVESQNQQPQQSKPPPPPSARPRPPPPSTVLDYDDTQPVEPKPSPPPPAPPKNLRPPPPPPAAAQPVPATRSPAPMPEQPSMIPPMFAGFGYGPMAAEQSAQHLLPRPNTSMYAMPQYPKVQNNQSKVSKKGKKKKAGAYTYQMYSDHSPNMPEQISQFPQMPIPPYMQSYWVNQFQPPQSQPQPQPQQFQQNNGQEYKPPVFDRHAYIMQNQANPPPQVAAPPPMMLYSDEQPMANNNDTTGRQRNRNPY